MKKGLDIDFTKNENFRKDYDFLYKSDPQVANLFLLMCELADENGEVEISDSEIGNLMMVRFNNPAEYAI